MREYLYLLSMGMVLGTVLLVFGMKYLSAWRLAQARIKEEDAYRDLAGRAASAQTENTALLSAIRAELAEVKSRLGAVEHILKAVE